MANLTFSYTAAVPQGTQQINNTQVPIENNFEDMAQLFAINHTPFNTAAAPDTTPGLHSLVTYFGQSADPTPVANAINMYSKAVAGDVNLYELFYQYPNGSVQQLTGTGSSGSTTSTGGAVIYSSLPFPGYTGYQYIGGGILMKFGYCIISNPGSSSCNSFLNTFSYPVATNIPAFTSTPFFIVGSPQNSYVLPNGQSGSPNLYNGITATSSTTYTVGNAVCGTYTVGGSVAETMYQGIYWIAMGV